jgi:hypothetical protein
MLAVVGVAESVFFGPELTGLSLSVISVAVVDSLLWECRSDAEGFREPWAASGSSAIASAAFLFRVIGGVVKVTAKMPGVISGEIQTSLGKTCDGHGQRWGSVRSPSEGGSNRCSKELRFGLRYWNLYNSIEI